MSIMNTLSNLWDQTAFMNLEWGNYVMILVALVFLYLAIRHGFEPLLLVPIAFGMLLVNIYPDIMAEPYVDAMGIEHAGGLLHYFFILDEWSILPSLIFMGVGAMTDFGPLIANPKSFILGAAQLSWVSTVPIFWQFCWDSTEKQQQLFPSSVVLMDRLPSSLPVNWDRQNLWDRLRWQHILICHWFRLSSRRS